MIALYNLWAWLSGRALARQAQDPGFSPQLQGDKSLDNSKGLMRAFRWQALPPFQPQLEVLWAFQLCYHCAIKPGCGDTYLSSQTVTVILKISKDVNPVSLCMGFYEKMLGWSQKGCLPMQALCFPMKASWGKSNSLSGCYRLPKEGCLSCYF